jgi:hypothetical protein
MSDDRRRVLDLLAQGKVTVEEADQLLRALAESSSAPEEPKTTADEPTTPRFVRINVHKPGKQGRPDKDVNIRVPLALLRGGMRLSTMIPGLQERMSARLRERGVDIDLAKFDSSSIEAMIKDLGEVHIDVHEGDEQVRITCE